jgi:hypothetical protein
MVYKETQFICFSVEENIMTYSINGTSIFLFMVKPGTTQAHALFEINEPLGF